MTHKTALYLLASEDAFALYSGEDPRHLTALAHRTAAALGDVHHGHRSEPARGATSNASFAVGPESGAEKPLERAALARHAVPALQAEWDKGGHDRITLAAGPKMLGALRDALPKALLPVIAAELHKDLMKIPPHELPAHLGASA